MKGAVEGVRMRFVPSDGLVRCTLAGVPTGRDLLFCFALIWANRRGERRGAPVQHLARLADRLMFDRIEETGERITLDDETRFGDYMHVVWSNRLRSDARRVLGELVYVAALNQSNGGNKRLETRLQSAGTDRNPTRREVRLRSGFEYSLDERGQIEQVQLDDNERRGPSIPQMLDRRLDKWGRLAAWSGMMVMHVGIVLMVDFADLTLGMVMIHLFTFDPDWLAPRRDGRQPVLFYDGECGLCNWVVRFLLREDAAGRMKYAPLQSAPAQAYLRAQGLPTADFDSLVFVPDWNDQAKGAYRLRTAGVLGAAGEIGGIWRVLSWARVLPAVLRDGAYKLVARFRYTLFGEYRPSPLPDPTWAARFL